MATGRFALGFAIVLFCASLPGCGSSAHVRLSADNYRAELAKIQLEEVSLGAALYHAFTGTSVATLVAELHTYASSQDRMGNETARLEPPTDAESANTLLATALHDTARAIRNILPAVARLKSPKKAISLVDSKTEPDFGAKPGLELSQATGELARLGYLKRTEG